MSKALRLTDHYLAARRQFVELFRLTSTTPAGMAATAASGTVALVDDRGGGLLVTSAAADNAVTSILTNNKLALVAADKPLAFFGELRYTEAASTAANLFVGMTSTTPTLTITDNGAGPAANFSGLGFYKTDGGSANWSVILSNGAVQTKVELNAAATLNRTAQVAASANLSFFDIEVFPKTATLADVVFSINGSAVYKATDWNFASSVAMAAGVICKAGTTAAQAFTARQFGFASVL